MANPARRQATVLWAVLALLLFIALGTARAEQLCLPREDAVAQLGAQFDERVIGRGLVGSGEAMVELFVSEGGTWTVVLTDTAGLSCVIASGEDWSDRPLLVGQVS